MSVSELLLAYQAEIGPASEAAIAYLPADYSPIASMRAVAPTVCAILGAEIPAEADEAPINDVVETLADSERIAHIVIDAFGVATWKCHTTAARTFGALAGIRQAELQSVLPAITPVNFSTIASGASPERHTVRNREETLTVDTSFARLAAAGRATAVCGRAISTTGILLAGHSDVPSRAESNTDKEVMELFVQRTGEHIEYILAQLLDVDEAGHAAGPFSVRSRQAVARTDFRLATMARAAADHGYALLLHADHGQHDIEAEDEAPEGMMGTHSGRRQEDVRVPFIYLTNTELRQALDG